MAESTVRAQVGDLLRAACPSDERPPMEELLPPGIAAILGEAEVDGYGFEGSAMHTPGDADERLAWMDRVGIDVANTICLEGADYASRLSTTARSHERRSAPATAGSPTASMAIRTDFRRSRSIDATDVDVERRRARADATRAGAERSSSTRSPRPGYPPMHERYEPLWSAAEDLGMLAFVHAGHSPGIVDPAWANYPDGMVLRQLGASQMQPVGDPHAERHGRSAASSIATRRSPSCSPSSASTGSPAPCSTWRTAGRPCRSRRVYMGRYPYELTPSEFVRRNVRITPLPRAHQSPVRLLEELPECVVFSSDYAHQREQPGADRALRNGPRRRARRRARVVPRREPR